MAYTTKQFYRVEEINSESAKTLPLELPRSSEFLFNRELSLIEFFRRVLGEGLDNSQPLLERLKFLSILSSNLDEFFMIRVSGLKEKFADKISPDGMTPAEQLTEIRKQVSDLIDEQMRCLHEEILPALSDQGIEVTSYKSLSEIQQKNLDEYFQNKIYPILTPQAVDPSHPFPYISGGSLNLGLVVRPKVSRRIEKVLYKTGDDFFVRLKIPSSIPRLIPVEKNSTKYVLAEDLIAANIQTLVSDSKPNLCFPFRITRDGDIGLQEAEAEDLLEMMEENLKQRRFGEVVRLEVSDQMPDEMVNYLKDSLETKSDEIYKINGLIKITDLMSLYKLNRPDLKDAPLFVSKPTVFNRAESTFELIKKQDILLHHPYMPYSIVTNFIKEAAEDAKYWQSKCVFTEREQIRRFRRF